MEQVLRTVSMPPAWQALSSAEHCWEAARHRQTWSRTLVLTYFGMRLHSRARNGEYGSESSGTSSGTCSQSDNLGIKTNTLSRRTCATKNEMLRGQLQGLPNRMAQIQDIQQLPCSTREGGGCCLRLQALPDGFELKRAPEGSLRKEVPHVARIVYIRLHAASG